MAMIWGGLLCTRTRSSSILFSSDRALKKKINGGCVCRVEMVVLLLVLFLVLLLVLMLLLLW